MKTEVIMKRKLLGGEIRQKSKSEFLCATDLVKVGNEFRRSLGLNHFNLSQYLKQKGTKEFIAELFRVKNVDPVSTGRGRNSGGRLRSCHLAQPHRGSVARHQPIDGGNPARRKDRAGGTVAAF